MKKALITITLIAGTLTLSAQNEIDALRYSQQDVFGNARFAAMSGAFGALGGEFSSLSYNPAGIGMYQFNEFTFTPSFSLHNSKSYFNTSNIDDDKMGLNISNLGLVYSMPKNNSEWKRINIALGWNQLASYERNIRIEGENSSSSLADKILELANGNKINDLNEFHTSLAFWTDLIDLANNTVDTATNCYGNDNGNYISHISRNNNKLQSKNIHSTGSENEFVFSVSGSYNEKLYIGATVGLPRINYYEKSTYTESEFADTAAHLQSFDYEEELSTTGQGFNLKLGVIARLNDWVKVGGAYHSHTFYDMEDEYSTAITAVWNDTLGTKYDSSPFGYFNYELKTPWKAIGSVAINIKKQGLITADVEMIDYSSAKFNSDTYKFTDENKLINATYTKATNIRLGGELKYKEFRFRGGYALYGSPYKDNAELERKSYTFGLGVNRGHFIVDFAYVFSEGSDEHFMYSSDLVDAATIIATSHNFLFTLGLRY